MLEVLQMTTSPKWFQSTTLVSFCHSPLVAWGLSHRKQHWKYSHIPLLLYILCDEECTPTAIVAKMWSRLLFPARICSLQHWSQIEASSSLGTDRPSWQTEGEKKRLRLSLPSRSVLPEARQRRRLLNSNWSVLLQGLHLMQSLELTMRISVSVSGQMCVIVWVERWIKRQMNSWEVVEYKTNTHFYWVHVK